MLAHSPLFSGAAPICSTLLFYERNESAPLVQARRERWQEREKEPFRCVVVNQGTKGNTKMSSMFSYQQLATPAAVRREYIVHKSCSTSRPTAHQYHLRLCCALECSGTFGGLKNMLTLEESKEKKCTKSFFYCYFMGPAWDSLLPKGPPPNPSPFWGRKFPSACVV